MLLFHAVRGSKGMNIDIHDSENLTILLGSVAKNHSFGLEGYGMKRSDASQSLSIYYVP